MDKAWYTILRAVLLFCTAILMSFLAGAQVITTVAGSGVAGYYGDNGPATAAALDSPGCIAADRWGNIYISDQLNNCVRKVNAVGMITTIAGTGAPGYNGDGVAATAAQLSSNWGVAVDNAGNVYIADQNNSRIRKVSTSGIITTIAGTGSAGFSGDNGSATNAKIGHPIGVAVDSWGNVYFGDADNYRVRRISASGVITTIAGIGNGGYSGDGGPATAARIEFMWGLATDAAGYVYICDAWNSRVRRADPAPGGLITTVAGNGDPGSGGDGSAATAANLSLPTGVYVNASNEIFIADCRNNKIRKVGVDGTIHTVAGTGVAGFSGDGGLATWAQLNRPLSVCGDQQNNLFVADLDNVRVREIGVVSLLFFAGGDSQSVNVCQDAAHFSIDSLMSVIDYTPGSIDTWSVVLPPVHGEIDVDYDSVSSGGILVPSGLSYTPAAGYQGSDAFRIRVTNGTLSDTIRVNVTVIPLLTGAGAITGPSVLCSGFAVALTDSLGSGTWSSSNNSISIDQAGGSGVVTGMHPGQDTILYIRNNGCSADTAWRTISVLPVPDAGAISGLNTVCVSATITLSDYAPGGAWSSGDSMVTVAAGIVTGRYAGPGLIIYSVSNAACIATATYIVHVDGFPAVPVISGQGNLCVGAQVSLDGGSGLGIWSSDAANIAAVNAQTGLVNGLAAGTATISYVVTNSCGASAAVKTMTVDPLPDAPAITRKENIMYAPVGFAGYQWLLDGAPIADAVADTFYVTASGVYGVSVSSPQGCYGASPPYAYSGCNADDLEIYPNPVQTKACILWCDKTNVRVATADGKILLTADDTNSIDLSSLPDGVYMVTVYDGKGKKIKTKRITKVAK